LSLVAPGPATAGVGDFDVRFSSHGALELERPGPVHVVQQPDGRLVVLAHPATEVAGYDASRLELRRYVPSGLLDTSFGNAGRLVVPTPGGSQPSVTDAALQPDGKIVIGGAASVGGEPWVRFLARIDGSGALDSTFGIGGLINGGSLSDFYAGYNLIRVLPDGDIVALMQDADGDQSDGSRNVVDRFDRDGRRVSSRDVEGTPIALVALGGGDTVLASQTTSGVRVIRLRRDGAIDSAFGVNGVINLPGWYGAVGALASPAGLMLCGGGEVRRFDFGGRLDPGFGPNGNGVVNLEQTTGLRLRQCNGLLTNAAGSTFVVASDVQGTFEVWRATVAIGLDSSGELDPAFGAGAGFNRIRGLQSPDQQWRTRSVFTASDGNARLVWNYVSGTGSGMRIDAIDLGQGDGPSAVGVAPGRLRVTERAAFLEINVARNGRPIGAASVRYETTPGSADALDFTPISGTLRWADGDASPRRLQLLVVNDSLVEGEESFELRTFDATGALTTTEPVVVTIADDDALRALRFSEDRITWTTGPGVPVDSWAQWQLSPGESAAGPVTAYFYFSNGIDACCAGAVSWVGGDTGVRTIAPFRGEALGPEFYVSIIDESWEDAGPYASVKVVVDPTPPDSGGGGGGGNPDAGSSGGRSGGGGSLGLLDAALLVGMTLAVAWRRPRRLGTVAHPAFG
jgi:hypothetical protein